MIEKPLLYCMAKMVTVIASILLLGASSVDMTISVISTLSFACIFLLELLFQRILKSKGIVLILTSTAIFACFVLGLDVYFPLYIILLIHFFDLTVVQNNFFYEILGVTFLLSIFIFNPSKDAMVLSVLIVAFLLFTRYIMDKLFLYKQIADEQKEQMNELHKKLNDIKSLMKTVKSSVSLEERNRIAARLHDQIGHGISGSIIMLEAAMLILKENQEKAVGSIQIAINNLRSGVDEIRLALREERPDRYMIGINDITALLEEFKVSYSIDTNLKTIGELDHIRLDIWACMQDNLKECLTNVLKHSNATEFTLNIEVFQKLVKVEFKDNGRSMEGFEKGLGLEAIEERTIHSKGKCFFSKGEKGFCVTNIFLI